MTQEEYQQAVNNGQVDFVQQPTQTTEDQLPPLSPDDYQPILEQIRRPKAHIATIPTLQPRNFLEQIQLLDDGVKQKLLAYINGSWREFGAFDPFSKFIDLVHFNSIDGFTVTTNAGGQAAASDAILVLSTSGTSGSSVYVCSKNRYVKICEAGKLLTVEWQLSYLNSYDTMYLFMTDDISAPPSPGSHHFGFRISSSFYKASTGNGTSGTTTTLEAPLNSIYHRKRLKAVCNRGTDVKFYVDDVLVATHTTNLPNTDDLYLNMGISIGGSTQFDAWINRVLITKDY